MKNATNSLVQFYGICSLERNWWLFGLRGALSILFGILAIAMPRAAMLAMTLVFGVYAFIDGTLFLIAGLRHARAHEHWGWLIFAGIAGIATGLIVFFMPLLA